jgi:glycosylphosphatidylinositol transamidase (GPIT) subunit GPI8
VAVLDRFTWALLEFAKNINSTSAATVQDLFNSLDPKFLSSHPDLKQSDMATPPMEARIVDFLGNVRTVETDVDPVFLQDRSEFEKFTMTPKFKITLDETLFLEQKVLGIPSREFFLLRPSQPLLGSVFPMFVFLILSYSLYKAARLMQ